MSDEAAFLDALAANPADDTARLVYADWLDEHGEPAKAEYLRLVVALARAETDYARDQPDVARTLALAEALPAEWRAAAGNRFKLVFYAPADGARLIATIKALRTVTGIGLAEAKSFVEGDASVLLATTSCESGLLARDTIREAGGIVRLYPCDSPPVLYQLIARRTPDSSDSSASGDVERRKLFATLLHAAFKSISAAHSRRLARDADRVVIAEHLDSTTAVKRWHELNQLLPWHLDESESDGWVPSAPSFGVWIERLPMLPPTSPK